MINSHLVILNIIQIKEFNAFKGLGAFLGINWFYTLTYLFNVIQFQYTTSLTQN